MLSRDGRTERRKRYRKRKLHQRENTPDRGHSQHTHGDGR